MDAVFKELQGESDRAAVILVAAHLEDSLMIKVMSRMRKPPDGSTIEYYDDVFAPNRPLGSFSAKIDAAYFFEIIDDTMRAQLNDVREMRNACAHSQHPISFADSALVNVCKRIFAPTGVMQIEAGAGPKEIRLAFVLEYVILELSIFLGSQEAAILEMERMRTRGEMPAP